MICRLQTWRFQQTTTPQAWVHDEDEDVEDRNRLADHRHGLEFAVAEALERHVQLVEGEAEQACQSDRERDQTQQAVVEPEPAAAIVSRISTSMNHRSQNTGAADASTPRM